MSDTLWLEIAGTQPPVRYEINRPSLAVGRSPECDILISNPQISRRHALILHQGDTVLVQDLGSANGVLVNGHPAKLQKLSHNDQITLGPVTLVFHRETDVRVSLTDEAALEANLTIAVPIAGIATSRRIHLPPVVSGAKGRRDAGDMLQVIFNAAKSLVGAGELEIVLNRVMDLVFEYLKPDRGFLMLADTESNELVPRIVKYRDGSRSTSTTITFSKTIAHKVFEEGVSILTSNAMGDSRFDQQESIVAQNIRSCMCVPLWDENKTIGIIYIDCLAFENYFVEQDLDLLSTIATISAIAIEQSRLCQEVTMERAKREKLQRYHSPGVVNRIVSAGAHELMQTEEREISVLFADLVGFTSFAEKLTPAEVAWVLNTHFTGVTDVIFKYDGTLDKYIGDAVMAVFGAPFPQKDHAARAVRAAVDMMNAIQTINHAGQLPVRLEMRIGINSGKVVAGDIGSEKRMDYTVLGSAVNIASRIESSVAKTGDIVLGEATARHLGNEFKTESLGPVPIRGISAPVTLYRLVLERGETTAAPLSQTLP